MNQENAQAKARLGRGIAATGLGILLAAISPASLLFSALLLIIIYRWAGLIPAIISAVFQLICGARYMGQVYLWIGPLLTLLPVGLLLAFEKKPFFTQLKISIGAFGGGMLAVVAVLYLNYGANLIEQLMLNLLNLARSIPEDRIAQVLEMVSSAGAVTVTAAEFYNVLEQTIAYLIPFLQQNLPGMLISIALVCGVGCAWLSGWMNQRKGTAVEGSYVPPSAWYLPASTTLGLCLMLGASFLLQAVGFSLGETALQTVLYIFLIAFCIQALCSVRRLCHRGGMKRGNCTAITILLAAFCMMGGVVMMTTYGFASALLGSHGAVRQYLEHKKNNSQSGGNE